VPSASPPSMSSMNSICIFCAMEHSSRRAD
jgi:hypothetical protein